MNRPWAHLMLLGLGLSVFPACNQACGKDMSSADPGTPAALASAAVAPPPNYNPNLSLAPLVERLQPAVVNIYVEQKVAVQTMRMPPGLAPFFGMPQGEDGDTDSEDGTDDGGSAHPYRTEEGEGSGFIISADGYILTNNHVVAKADKVKVRLSDQREFDARVVGKDPRTDVALVHIEAKADLPFVKLGSSEDLKVGDWVVAIGNPYGLSETVTAGIVSAKGRVIGAGPYDDFIQTDASINPGNSGGPLFNLAGEVVGINAAIIKPANSIGFSVPIDMVKPIIADLKADGKVARGWMGMGLQELDSDLATALKADPSTKGAVVSQVYPGFPAAEAGLKASDIITGLNGQPVTTSEALVRTVGAHKPGETVKLSILRDGKPKEISVTLKERPDEKSLAQGRFLAPEEDEDSKADARSAEASGKTPLARLGLSVDAASRYGLAAGGLVITNVKDSSPANGKLAAGDVISSINGTPITNADGLNKALSSSDKVALFIVTREHSQRLVAVPLKTE